MMLSAARHAPGDPEVHLVLGVLYNISLDFASAAEHFQQALALPAPALDGAGAGGGPHGRSM
jgi:uncharacterized protein HemY